MKEKRCKNCGAPLESYKCDFCGTQYYDPPQTVMLNLEDGNAQTIGCTYEVSLPLMNSVPEEVIEQKIKNEMAIKLSMKLLDYMDIKTWVNPERLTQVFGGRIRVLPPNSK